jgi:hypothetical protein
LSTDDQLFEQPIDPARLRAFMRTYLKLPEESSDEEIRAVLFRRDDGLLAWYDNRRNRVERIPAPDAAYGNPDRI